MSHPYRLLIFQDEKLVMEAKSMEVFHNTFYHLSSKGVLYTYSFVTEYWYKDLTCIPEEQVPAVYRTLKLLLPN